MLLYFGFLGLVFIFKGSPVNKNLGEKLKLKTGSVDADLSTLTKPGLLLIVALIISVYFIGSSCTEPRVSVSTPPSVTGDKLSSLSSESVVYPMLRGGD